MSRTTPGEETNDVKEDDGEKICLLVHTDAPSKQLPIQLSHLWGWDTIMSESLGSEHARDLDMDDRLDPRVTDMLLCLIECVTQLKNSNGYRTRMYSRVSDMFSILMTQRPFVVSYTHDYIRHIQLQTLMHVPQDVVGMVMDYLGCTPPDDVERYWVELTRQITHYKSVLYEKMVDEKLDRIDDGVEKCVGYCECDCCRQEYYSCNTCTGCMNLTWFYSLHCLNVCICLPCLCVYGCAYVYVSRKYRRNK